MSKFQGVITALVTPFKNGAVDYDSFRRLLKDQIKQSVNGFVVNGTTAESPTLTFDEVKKLYETTRAESSLPVIVGTGSNSTAGTSEFTKKVCEWKPDGVLVVVPYYNKPPQRGLQKHFEEVAKNSNVPVILYNVPGRTITSLEAATVGALSKTANIVGIKDATGDMNVLAATQKEVGSGKNFAYLSGDDGTCVDFASKGGHGVISVSSHVIGGEMAKAISLAKTGDKAAVSEYATKYADLMKWLYCEANPIPVKMALKMMGVIDSGEMRLPLMSLDEKFHKDLQACLKKLKENLKLAVVGASGRMGSEIIALAEQAGHKVSAKLDKAKSWSVKPADVDVLIDFSLPEGFHQALAWCVKNKTPFVSGTTGLSEKDKKQLKEAAKTIPVLYSANMSLGIAVMSAMLEQFQALEDWDFHIDEVHHNQKKDSPSGTALLLDNKLSQVLDRKLPTPNSIRGGGVPGIHQVWAMGPEEVVVLQHTAFNRKVFARGALKAAVWLFDKTKPGLYDLSDLYKQD